MSNKEESELIRTNPGVTTRNSSSRSTGLQPAAMVGGSGKPAGDTNKPVADLQKVLDRLDMIEKSLEKKIDASIQSQEFSASHLQDNIKKFETANDKVNTKCDELAESNIGMKAQLKVQGTRLQD